MPPKSIWPFWSKNLALPDVKLKLFSVLILTAAALQAQTPSIAAGGVYNTASYVPAGLPGAGIAQGSLFVVFGSNMGPGNLAAASSYPYPTSLNGTSMSVTVSGTTVKPYMVYTSAGQVGGLMPSNTPVGTGTITVTFNGATSAPQPITIAASSVGIFTVNQAGSGPGIITTASYVVNSLTTAATAGDANIIWATGMGPVGASGNEASGTAPLAAVPSTFQVYVGGVAAKIYGVARSPYPGLDQIVFYVPAGVSGCHVPVVVQTNNTVSNFVTMAVGTGGVCSDPVGTGLTSTQLAQLQQKGTVSLGSIGLDRTTSGAITVAGFTLPGSTTDSGGASFERYTFQQYTAATGGINVTTFGACSVYFATGTSGTPADPVVPTPLDAGPSITVTGPSGTKTLTSSAQTPGIYSATLGGVSGAALFLNPGNYLITGTGGTDVGPISTNITLPPALTWTNASSITNVIRANGQLITWTGGDPLGSVEITGYSAFSSGNNTVVAGFECTAPTSAGQFTIPAVVLLALPSSPAPSASSTSFALGSLGVGAVAAVKNFTATGIDLGYLTSVFSSAQTVTYQ
jgi:uncharacterized protein (TIGR03437 family)